MEVNALGSSIKPFPFESLIEINDFHFEKDLTSSKPEPKFVVEGYASTTDLDLNLHIITEDALKDASGDLLKYSTILLNHDKTRPIGRIIRSEVRDGKLWIKVQISNTESDIQNKIKDGTLSKFSIAGRIENFDRKMDDELKKEVLIIKKMQLFEVSLVSTPANVEAKAMSWYIEKGWRNNIMAEEKGTNLKNPVAETAAESEELEEIYDLYAAPAPEEEEEEEEEVPEEEEEVPKSKKRKKSKSPPAKTEEVSPTSPMMMSHKVRKNVVAELIEKLYDQLDSKQRQDFSEDVKEVVFNLKNSSEPDYGDFLQAINEMVVLAAEEAVGNFFSKMKKMDNHIFMAAKEPKSTPAKEGADLSKSINIKESTFTSTLQKDSIALGDLKKDIDSIKTMLGNIPMVKGMGFTTDSTEMNKLRETEEYKSATPRDRIEAIIKAATSGR